MAIPKFERFFRLAADLEVDKQDLKRYSDFVNQKVYGMLLMAEATARANGRGMIEPHDLPLTKGLQECMHQFRAMDSQLDLKPILEQLATMPQLDLLWSEETEARLPWLVGSLSVGLGRALRLLDTKRRHPSSEDWKRVFELFDVLL